MTSRLVAALQAHRKVRRLDTDRVLTLDGGRAFHRDAFRKNIMRVERRAERGSAISGTRSALAMRGAPAKAIHELAGHADLTTTMRYMHLSPAARTQAIDMLEQKPSGNPTATECGAAGCKK